MANLARVAVVLLHEGMRDKQRQLVTTSLTLIDVHDISRSVTTFGGAGLYVAHPSQYLRQLARELQSHWKDGFGKSYNPNRHEALQGLHVVARLDDAIADMELRFRERPCLVATSAKGGEQRLTFSECAALMQERPCLLMLGTGHGMSEELLRRADVILEPIKGPGDYNHLSVRSALAIMLDRLAAQG